MMKWFLAVEGQDHIDLTKHNVGHNSSVRTLTLHFNNSELKSLYNSRVKRYFLATIQHDVAFASIFMLWPQLMHNLPIPKLEVVEVTSIFFVTLTRMTDPV